MKRIIAIVLALVLCLSLCSCGKSKEVKEVEEAIDDIGKVTLDSKEDIEEAELLYEELSEEDKDKVENYSDLEEAREEYDNLLVQDVQEKIDAIDLTDPNANDAYQIAKDAYDALPVVLLEKIENADRLQLAETVSSLLITNFQSVSAAKPNLFEEDVDTWYGDLDAAATLHVCFWLQVYSSKEVNASNVSLSPYVAYNEEDGRVDLYATYGSDAIVCFQYWPEEKVAQVGTVTTDVELEDYVQTMKDAGVIDDFKAVPLSNIRKIVDLMS